MPHRPIDHKAGHVRPSLRIALQLVLITSARRECVLRSHPEAPLLRSNWTVGG